jgi:UDP-N-acetylmuramoylalanine--D-glutamate ligase
MKKEIYLNANVLVVGLGLSGRAAASFLLTNGAKVSGVDQNLCALEGHSEFISLKEMGLLTLQEQSIQNLKAFDFVVMSPGISPFHPIYQEIIRSNKPVLGEIELGCRSVNNPMLGITGTNGKTTVTLLVSHVLNCNGKKGRALGNVGVPLTRELGGLSSEEILVLELSSYQLETLYRPVLDAAVILNITPDHLDRYACFESYAEAKLNLERCLKETGVLYLDERTFVEFGSHLKTDQYKVFGYSPYCHISSDLTSVYMDGKKVFDLPTAHRGAISHHLENIMASYALCHEMGISPAGFVSALESFKKPPHRIEFVAEKKGVLYYDDSKGTNVDAVIRAVQSLSGPIILIAGGVDKGSSYVPWLEGFANKVKCVCAIGLAAGKIKTQLSHDLPVELFTDMDQAVSFAANLARPGDNVLLSPGCSSFDMFRDYAHRGEEFQRIVHGL